MTPLARRFLHVATAAVALTGIVFAVMKYAMKTDDPYAVVNSPWQPWVLAAHVVAAPFLVFGIGWIFQTHILQKKKAGAPPRRRSGLMAFWFIAPMILTGYLLQVSTAEWLRNGAAIAHWATSGAFVIAYLVHQIIRDPRKGRRRMTSPDEG